MVSRCLLILLDGLGDRSCPVLANRTPLQAARTPNLDRLARLGANGLFHAARPGIVLPSENAHFHMFGYKAQEFPGRGLFEALGAGIPATHDDVFVLAHMVTLKQQKGHLKVMFEHPKAPEEECTALARAIQSLTWNNIDFRFTQTHGPDGIVRLNPSHRDHVIAVVDHVKNGLDDLADFLRLGKLTAHARGHDLHADIAFVQFCRRQDADAARTLDRMPL